MKSNYNSELNIENKILTRFIFLWLTNT